MEPYASFKQRIENELTEFLDENGFYAFDEGQFTIGMAKLGLRKSDTGMIVHAGSGMYVLKDHVKDLLRLIDDLTRRKQEYLSSDDTLMEALVYEIKNHEYIIGEANGFGDEGYQNVIDALGIDGNSTRVKKMFEKAVKKSIGADELPRNGTTDHFIEVRRRDPSFTGKQVVKEYLLEHEDELRVAVEYYWDNHVGDNRLMDMEYFLDEFIKGLEPEEALRLGLFAKEFNYNDKYVEFNGYDNIERTLDEIGYLDKCKDTVGDSDFVEKVLDGSVPVPEELCKILGMWGETDVVSYSPKPRKKSVPKVRVGHSRPAKRPQPKKGRV